MGRVQEHAARDKQRLDGQPKVPRRHSKVLQGPSVSHHLQRRPHMRHDHQGHRPLHDFADQAEPQAQILQPGARFVSPELYLC